MKTAIFMIVILLSSFSVGVLTVQASCPEPTPAPPPVEIVPTVSEIVPPPVEATPGGTPVPFAPPKAKPKKAEVLPETGENQLPAMSIWWAILVIGLVVIGIALSPPNKE